MNISAAARAAARARPSQTTLSLLLLLPTLLLSLLPTPTTATNLLLNPDFEASGGFVSSARTLSNFSLASVATVPGTSTGVIAVSRGGSTSEWTTWPGGTMCAIAADASNNATGRFLVLDPRGMSPADAVWSSNGTLGTGIPVTPGGPLYRFSLYMRTLRSVTATEPAPVLRLEWRDASLGGAAPWTPVTRTLFSLNRGGCTSGWRYEYVDVRFPPAPPLNVTLRLVSTLVVATGADFALDRLSFGVASLSPVPFTQERFPEPFDLAGTVVTSSGYETGTNPANLATGTFATCATGWAYNARPVDNGASATTSAYTSLTGVYAGTQRTSLIPLVASGAAAAPSVPGAWVQYCGGMRRRPSVLRLQTSSLAANSPADLLLLGSNDNGASWTVLSGHEPAATCSAPTCSWINVTVPGPDAGGADEAFSCFRVVFLTTCSNSILSLNSLVFVESTCPEGTAASGPAACAPCTAPLVPNAARTACVAASTTPASAASTGAGSLLVNGDFESGPGVGFVTDAAAALLPNLTLASAGPLLLASPPRPFHAVVNWGNATLADWSTWGGTSCPFAADGAGSGRGRFLAISQAGLLANSTVWQTAAPVVADAGAYRLSFLLRALIPVSPAAPAPSLRAEWRDGGAGAAWTPVLPSSSSSGGRSIPPPFSLPKACSSWDYHFVDVTVPANTSALDLRLVSLLAPNATGGAFALDEISLVRIGSALPVPAASLPLYPTRDLATIDVTASGWYTGQVPERALSGHHFFCACCYGFTPMTGGFDVMSGDSGYNSAGVYTGPVRTQVAGGSPLAGNWMGACSDTPQPVTYMRLQLNMLFQSGVVAGTLRNPVDIILLGSNDRTGLAPWTLVSTNYGIDTCKPATSCRWLTVPVNATNATAAAPGTAFSCYRFVFPRTCGDSTLSLPALWLFNSLCPEGTAAASPFAGSTSGGGGGGGGGGVSATTCAPCPAPLVPDATRSSCVRPPPSPPLNMLTNGDFELGQVGFWTDLKFVPSFQQAYTPTSSPGYATIINLGRAAMSDIAWWGATICPVADRSNVSETARFFIFDADDRPTSSIWEHATPVAVVANTTYRFSVFLRAIINYGTMPILIPQYRLGGSGSSAWVNISTPASRWSMYKGCANAWRYVWADLTLPQSANITLRLSQNQIGIVSTGNDGAMDDVVFAPISALLPASIPGWQRFPESADIAGGSFTFTASGWCLTEAPMTAFSDNVNCAVAFGWTPTTSTNGGCGGSSEYAASGFFSGGARTSVVGEAGQLAGAWLQMCMPWARAYHLLRMRLGRSTTRHPVDFVILGSNNGGATWTRVQTVFNSNTCTPATVGCSWLDFPITASLPAPGAFSCYRIVVTRSCGDIWMSLQTIQFWENACPDGYFANSSALGACAQCLAPNRIDASRTRCVAPSFPPSNQLQATGQNPSFEDGLTGFVSPLTYVYSINSAFWSANPSVSAGYTVINAATALAAGLNDWPVRSFLDRSNTVAGRFLFASPDPPATVFWGPTIRPLNVILGETYRVSVWMRCVTSADPALNRIGNDMSIDIQRNGTGAWVRLVTSWTLGRWAPWAYFYVDWTATWTGGLNMRFLSLATTGYGNDMALDDLSFALADDSTDAPSWSAPRLSWALRASTAANATGAALAAGLWTDVTETVGVGVAAVVDAACEQRTFRTWRAVLGGPQLAAGTLLTLTLWSAAGPDGLPEPGDAPLATATGPLRYVLDNITGGGATLAVLDASALLPDPSTGNPPVFLAPATTRRLIVASLDPATANGQSLRVLSLPMTDLTGARGGRFRWRVLNGVAVPNVTDTSTWSVVPRAPLDPLTGFPVTAGVDLQMECTAGVIIFDAASTLPNAVTPQAPSPLALAQAANVSSSSSSSSSSISPNASVPLTRDRLTSVWRPTSRALLMRISVYLARVSWASQDPNAQIRLDLWSNVTRSVVSGVPGSGSNASTLAPGSAGVGGACWIGGGVVSIPWADLPVFSPGAQPSANCSEVSLDVSELGLAVDPSTLYAISVAAIDVTPRGNETYAASVCARRLPPTAPAAAPYPFALLTRAFSSLGEGEGAVTTAPLNSFSTSPALTAAAAGGNYALHVSARGVAGIPGLATGRARLAQCESRPWPGDAFAPATDPLVNPLLPSQAISYPFDTLLADNVDALPALFTIPGGSAAAGRVVPAPDGPWMTAGLLPVFDWAAKIGGPGPLPVPAPALVVGGYRGSNVSRLASPFVSDADGFATYVQLYAGAARWGPDPLTGVGESRPVLNTTCRWRVEVWADASAPDGLGGTTITRPGVYLGSRLLTYADLVDSGLRPSDSGVGIVGGEVGQSSLFDGDFSVLTLDLLSVRAPLAAGGVYWLVLSGLNDTVVDPTLHCGLAVGLATADEFPTLAGNSRLPLLLQLTRTTAAAVAGLDSSAWATPAANLTRAFIPTLVYGDVWAQGAPRWPASRWTTVPLALTGASAAPSPSSSATASPSATTSSTASASGSASPSSTTSPSALPSLSPSASPSASASALPPMPRLVLDVTVGSRGFGMPDCSSDVVRALQLGTSGVSQELGAAVTGFVSAYGEALSLLPGAAAYTVLLCNEPVAVVLPTPTASPSASASGSAAPTPTSTASFLPPSPNATGPCTNVARNRTGPVHISAALVAEGAAGVAGPAGSLFFSGAAAAGGAAGTFYAIQPFGAVWETDGAGTPRALLGSFAEWTLDASSGLYSGMHYAGGDPCVVAANSAGAGTTVASEAYVALVCPASASATTTALVRVAVSLTGCTHFFTLSSPTVCGADLRVGAEPAGPSPSSGPPPSSSSTPTPTGTPTPSPTRIPGVSSSPTPTTTPTPTRTPTATPTGTPTPSVTPSSAAYVAPVAVVSANLTLSGGCFASALSAPGAAEAVASVLATSAGLAPDGASVRVSCAPAAGGGGGGGLVTVLTFSYAVAGASGGSGVTGGGSNSNSSSGSTPPDSGVPVVLLTSTTTASSTSGGPVARDPTFAAALQSVALAQRLQLAWSADATDGGGSLVASGPPGGMSGAAAAAAPLAALLPVLQRVANLTTADVGNVTSSGVTVTVDEAQAKSGGDGGGGSTTTCTGGMAPGDSGNLAAGTSSDAAAIAAIALGTVAAALLCCWVYALVLLVRTRARQKEREKEEEEEAAAFAAAAGVEAGGSTPAAIMERVYREELRDGKGRYRNQAEWAAYLRGKEVEKEILGGGGEGGGDAAAVMAAAAAAASPSSSSSSSSMLGAAALHSRPAAATARVLSSAPPIPVRGAEGGEGGAEGVDGGTLPLTQNPMLATAASPRRTTSTTLLMKHAGGQGRHGTVVRKATGGGGEPHRRAGVDGEGPSPSRTTTTTTSASPLG